MGKIQKSSKRNGKNKGTIKCFFCRKKGHKKFGCFKYKAWLDKKNNEQGKSHAYIYLEPNIVDVSIDSWWLDSGATIHITTIL